MKLLTNSRASAFRTCARLHSYKYEQSIYPAEEPEALAFGSLIHRALEAWWTSEPLGMTPLVSALRVLNEGEADPFDRAKGQAMMHGYHERWAAALEGYEVIAIEAEFNMPLVNPATGRPSPVWRIGGKLDGLIRERATGDVLVLEHKTASGDISPGSEYVRRLKMDSQVSLYFDGATALGHPPARVLYDVLGKPALRPLKAGKQRDRDETPEEYRDRCVLAIAEDPNKFFQRSDVVRLESEMDEARFDIWQTAQAIHESERANRWPRNPSSCLMYGRTCPYFAACADGVALDDPRYFKKSDKVHPELSGEESRANGSTS